MSVGQVLGPEILVAVVGGLLPLLGAFRLPRHLLAAIAGIALVLAGLLSVALVAPVPGLGDYRLAVQDLPVVGGDPVALGVFEVTPFAVLFKLVFLGVSLLVVLASPSYMAPSRHQGEYYGLLLLATLGMMAVASSRDLITLFIGFETASIATFALVAFFKDSLDGTEAAMKYFIVGALSAALSLFGISILYGLTGSVAFDQIGEVSNRVPEFGSTPLAVFAWGFLVAGFGFKIALVPFHMWAIDTYDGAPATVSALLSAGSKQLGFVALFKLFLVALLASKAHWDVLVGVVAVVTMTVGNLLALQQTSVKRMLAYSSVAQAGYLLIAIPIAGGAVDADVGTAVATFALVGALFHIVTYAIMKSGAFLAVAGAASAGVPDTFEGWRGMGRKAPFLGLSMTLFMLSFAGVPPLAGFASKFVLFSAAVQAGSWYVWLAVAGILNSALSLFYYLRIVRVMYVDETGPVAPYARSLGIPWGAVVAVGIAAVLTVAFGVWPTPVLDFTGTAAEGFLPATLFP